VNSLPALAIAFKDGSMAKLFEARYLESIRDMASHRFIIGIAHAFVL
jgi:hypothetical protein